MKNGYLDFWQQDGKQLYTITIILCKKIIPEHNLITEIYHNKFKCEKCQKCWDSLFALLWCIKMRASVENVETLRCTLSQAFSNKSIIMMGIFTSAF